MMLWYNKLKAVSVSETCTKLMRTVGFWRWRFDYGLMLEDQTDCMTSAQRLDVEKGENPIRFEKFE
jgi:hypothetical protein